MNKTINLLICLMMLLLYTCSKEEGFVPDQPGDDLLKAARGAVIYLSPSLDGDDTNELIDAFQEAKDAGPGSTVQLAEGEYHIGLIQVDYFYGSFKGAGKGKTIIVPLEELDCGALLTAELTPTLLKFFGGDVKVAQMSFRNSEGQPCEQCEENWSGDLWCFLGFFDWASGNVPPYNQIKAVVDQVEFSSNPNEPSGMTKYGVWMAIMSCGDFLMGSNLPYTNANMSITHCDFENLNYAFQNLGIGSGNFVFQNNRISNVDIALLLQDNIGGSTLISGNTFNIPGGGSGAVIDNLMWNIYTPSISNGCQYEISDNAFYTNESWAAIDFRDSRKLNGVVDNKNPLLILVKGNLINMNALSIFGIMNFCSNDAVIRNNKFTGQAVFTGIVSNITENCLMLGNNFSNMINTEHNIIVVGNNNTIVGGNNHGTSVLNLGENNVITGVKLDNEGENPVGQTISDNYKIIRENLSKFRKP